MGAGGSSDEVDFPCYFITTSDIVTGNEQSRTIPKDSLGYLRNFDHENDLIVSFGAIPGTHYIYLPDATALDFRATVQAGAHSGVCASWLAPARLCTPSCYIPFFFCMRTPSAV